VSVLENYFASTSFDAFVKHLTMRTYADVEVSNKTTTHRLVTQFLDTGNVCEKCSPSDKTAEITAVPISSSASAVTTGQEFNTATGFFILCVFMSGS
jgi:hypothetical protein